VKKGLAITKENWRLLVNRSTLLSSLYLYGHEQSLEMLSAVAEKNRKLRKLSVRGSATEKEEGNVTQVLDK
jgi:hypothetical protein